MTPLAYSIISISLAVIVFGIILYVGLKTDVLRESIPNFEMKNRPFSLGRTQLWIWTLIVCPIFILFWGYNASHIIDLNTTAVILLGIPAGVAVTSNVISSSQSSNMNKDDHVESQVVTGAIKNRKKTQIANAEIVATRAEGATAGIKSAAATPATTAPDPVVLKMHHESKSFFIDLITGDDGQLSLGRLQQLIFTMAFLVIYISSFFSVEMGKLPEFGTEVFALMGISSGTYLVSKGMNK